MTTQLRNRYKVVMHGNAPVVEDSATFKSVEWFHDVLHDATSRRRADQKAKQMNEQAEHE